MSQTNISLEAESYQGGSDVHPDNDAEQGIVHSITSSARGNQSPASTCSTPGPSTEALMDDLPVTKPLREITPRNAGSERTLIEAAAKIKATGGH